MTTVEIPLRADMPRTGSARRPMRWLVIVAVILAIALTIGLAFQAWLQVAAPAAHGSVTATLGETRPCDGSSTGDGTVTCREAPFSEGAPVGIGVTIRNDGPIAMTIVAIGSFGRDIRTTAVLDAQLLADESTFGIGEGRRPFAPITIEPGLERPIQLVGAFIGCEEAAAHYMPGSAIVLTHLDLTVRWLVADQRVQLPLRDVLSLSAPEAGACG